MLANRTNPDGTVHIHADSGFRGFRIPRIPAEFAPMSGVCYTLSHGHHNPALALPARLFPPVLFIIPTLLVAVRASEDWLRQSKAATCRGHTIDGLNSAPFRLSVGLIGTAMPGCT